MKPIAVTVSGFRAFGSERTINFNDGLTAIVGPNKSGKSSTFLAIMWALYGPAALRDIGITQGDCVHEGFDRCLVALEFEANGKRYDIIREYLASGTTHLKLQDIAEEVGGIDLTGATVRETQATIDALVGEYSVAAQSWYCGQDADKSFMFAPPSERMEVLSALLPSKTNWDHMNAICKFMRGGAENEVRDLESKAKMLDEWTRQVTQLGVDAASASNILSEARADLTEAEAELTRLQAEAEGMEKRKAAGELAAERKRTHENHSRVYNDTLVVIERSNEVRKAKAAYDEVVEQFGRDAAQHQIRQDEREQWEIARQIAYTDTALAMFEGDEAQCPTCQRVYEPGSEQAIAHVEEQRRILENKLDQDKAKRDVTIGVDVTSDKPELIPMPTAFVIRRDIEADVITLDNAEKNIEALEKVYLSSRESFETAKAALEDLGEPPDDMDEILRKVRIQPRVVDDVKHSEGNAIVAHARATERLETARKAVTTLAETETSLSAAHERLNDYELLVRATGPRGVRQLAVSQALAGINSTVNRALEILDPGTSLYLDTQREAGDGSQAETLEATITGQDGMAAFGTRSGAEKTRIAIAVRAGMEVARAQALGSESNATFIIDEAFGAQDVAGKDNFIRFLRWLVDDLGVNVLLVTHDADMQERFDQTIQVSKIDGEAVLA